MLNQESDLLQIQMTTIDTVQYGHGMLQLQTAMLVVVARVAPSFEKTKLVLLASWRNMNFFYEETDNVYFLMTSEHVSYERY